MHSIIQTICCRTSVTGFTASTMTVATATPRTYLPWMAPHVGQERLAAGMLLHVNLNYFCE